jgi:hypothetical protein
VPDQSSFDYAVIRVVPRVEREEFINAGLILFCPERRYLEARIHLDESRLQALWPAADGALIRRHLEAFPRISSGEADAGPIARLSQRERFHWLVAPRSTVIQVSQVHSGICENPQAAMDRLYRQLLLHDE